MLIVYIITLRIIASFVSSLLKFNYNHRTLLFKKPQTFLLLLELEFRFVETTNGSIEYDLLAAAGTTKITRLGAFLSEITCRTVLFLKPF